MSDRRICDRVYARHTLLRVTRTRRNYLKTVARGLVPRRMAATDETHAGDKPPRYVLPGF